MLGRDDDHVAALERAHHAHTDPLAAARAAFWIGINLTLRGESRAAGWFGRARRLVEREGRECVEQGYLALARMFEHRPRATKPARSPPRRRRRRSASASATPTCSRSPPRTRGSC